MDKIKRVLKRIKLISILYHILNNYLIRIRYKLGKFEIATMTTHTRFHTVSDSVNYINKVFNEYFVYSHLSPEYIQGKRILEIGPGDNFGVALKFLMQGASKVVCLDKFYSKRDLNQQYQIYNEMRANLTSDEIQIFDSIVKLDNNKFEIADNKFEYIYGKGIEDALDILPPASFDMIVSRAVMEHVCEPDIAFQSMDRLLKQNGYMIHNIDLRDHGIFTSAGMHPLTFLTIPDRTWRLMTYHSGKPNRMLVDYYKEKMAKLNYEFRIEITRIVGYESELPFNPSGGVDKKLYFDMALPLITKIRPKLQPRFRRLKNEDLAVAGIFLIAKKCCG